MHLHMYIYIYIHIYITVYLYTYVRVYCTYSVERQREVKRSWSNEIGFWQVTISRNNQSLYGCLCIAQHIQHVLFLQPQPQQPQQPPLFFRGCLNPVLFLPPNHERSSSYSAASCGEGEAATVASWETFSPTQYPDTTVLASRPLLLPPSRLYLFCMGAIRDHV